MNKKFFCKTILLAAITALVLCGSVFADTGKLIGQLVDLLGVTQSQAEGGAGGKVVLQGFGHLLDALLELSLLDERGAAIEHSGGLPEEEALLLRHVDLTLCMRLRLGAEPVGLAPPCGVVEGEGHAERMVGKALCELDGGVETSACLVRIAEVPLR